MCGGVAAAVSGWRRGATIACERGIVAGDDEDV